MKLLTRIRRVFENWRRNRRWSKFVASVEDYEMSPEEREEQRRSFVYGNVKLSNPEVTREMVDEVADKMQRGLNIVHDEITVDVPEVSAEQQEAMDKVFQKFIDWEKGGTDHE